MRYDKAKLRAFQEKAQQQHAALLDLGIRRDKVRQEYLRLKGIVRSAECEASRLPAVLLSDMPVEQLREKLDADKAAREELGNQQWGHRDEERKRTLRATMIPASVNRQTLGQMADLLEELSRLDAEHQQAAEKWRTAQELATRLSEATQQWDSTRRGQPAGARAGDRGAHSSGFGERMFGRRH